MATSTVGGFAGNRLVVVSVLELTSTGRKSEGKPDTGLQARQKAFAEIEKACNWCVFAVTVQPVVLTLYVETIF